MVCRFDTASRLSWGSGLQVSNLLNNAANNRSALTVGNFITGTLVGNGSAMSAPGALKTDINGYLALAMKLAKAFLHVWQ